MYVIEKTDFYDFFMLINKIIKRNEEDAYSEIRKIQLLTQVIHTSEPQQLIEELESSISGEPTVSDVGDLDKLRNFKQEIGDV